MTRYLLAEFPQLICPKCNSEATIVLNDGGYESYDVGVFCTKCSHMEYIGSGDNINCLSCNRPDISSEDFNNIVWKLEEAVSRLPKSIQEVETLTKELLTL